MNRLLNKFDNLIFPMLFFWFAILGFQVSPASQTVFTYSGNTVRSIQSGDWSSPSTWNTGTIPSQGDNVVIDSGHVVNYNIVSPVPIRLIHIRGKLVFSRSQNTELNVGMIILSMAESVDVNANCSLMNGPMVMGEPRPTLEVGTWDNPIPENITAKIRLVYFSDMNSDCAPGIISYSGRMDFHGAPLNHTWLKLAADATAGSSTIQVEQPVNWKVGDHIIITGSTFHNFSDFPNHSFLNTSYAQTEEKFITAISGNTITLNSPLQYDHLGSGEFRVEVANLSRNVIIESADPNGVRGHTMYHHGSKGSISYAEFAHLGKEGVLARYPIHYHIMRDTNRGSSVIGASVWDSHNRFVTVHGTDYLVVKDCVGYKSYGHGFFMEDASEVFNLFEHNLAVLVYKHDPLPNQALDYDLNEGAGFWWANGRNAFIGNSAVECDKYGYQFDIRDDIFTYVMQPNGTMQPGVQVNRLPFILFQDNEAHGNLFYGFWGNGDARPTDPFKIKNFKAWQLRYAMAANGNYTLLEDMNFWNIAYGFYGPEPKNAKVVNFRARDVLTHAAIFYLRPEGLITFENVYLENTHRYPLRITGKKPRNNPCEVHFRNYTLINVLDNKIVGTEGQNAQPTPEITMYLHDFFGPGQDAKVIPATQTRNDSLVYQTMPPTFDPNVKVAITNVPFPQNPINPLDSLPPATVILYPAEDQVFPANQSSITVVGTCIDASTVTSVKVNNQEVTPLSDNYRHWQITLNNIQPGPLTITSQATDEFGNIEQNPHVVHVWIGMTPTGSDSGNRETVIEGYKLIGNFPNPFNPQTSIKFQVAGQGTAQSRISLKIFDVFGRQVKNLTEEILPKGTYIRVWDGTDDRGNPVASGLYFYKFSASDLLTNNQFQEVKKMILIR